MTASLWAACTMIAVPTAEAAPRPFPPAPQATGHDARIPACFAGSPAPVDRDRAIDTALRSIFDHPGGAFVTAGNSFVPRNVVLDQGASAHVRFDRMYNGLFVYGGDIVVHLGADGSYASFDVANPTTGAVPLKPAVSAELAQAVAKAQRRGTITGVSVPRMAVRAAGSTAALVWDVTVSGVGPDQTPSALQVLVDALSGRVAEMREGVHLHVEPGQSPMGTAEAGSEAASVPPSQAPFTGAWADDCTVP